MYVFDNNLCKWAIKLLSHVDPPVEVLPTLILPLSYNLLIISDNYIGSGRRGTETIGN